jgi:hypothetical protein
VIYKVKWTELVSCSAEIEASSRTEACFIAANGNIIPGAIERGNCCFKQSLPIEEKAKKPKKVKKVKKPKTHHLDVSNDKPFYHLPIKPPIG